jgi:hypothetical protein
MAAVELEIQDPTHEERFVPAGTASNDTRRLPVAFRGAVSVDEPKPSDEGDPTLFFKWYSTLHAPPPDDDQDPGKYPLNPLPDIGDAEQVSHFERNLGLGTHVLTFTAKDRPGDSRDDLVAVEHAGMTGGAEGDHACVITVLAAQILEAPRVKTTSGQREVVLVGRAPARWAKNTGNDDEPAYELDDDYHGHNTVGYRWMLIPEDETDPAEWNPQPHDEALVFDIDRDGQPLLRFTADLPDGLSAGRCRVVLRVKDVSDVEDPERWYHETVWPDLLDIPSPTEGG